jgi:transporter family protein
VNGQVWALLSAFGYAGGNVMLRLGQATRADDSGMFATTLLALVVSGAAVAWQAPHGTLPRFTWAGAGLLALQGLLTAYAGRTLFFMAVRRIGPSRASPFKTVATVVTVGLAVPLLGERLTAPQWLGVAAVVGALFILDGAARLDRTAGPPAAEGAPRPQGAPRRTRPAVSGGTALGLASAACFGIGYLVRRLAIVTWPTPFGGMLVGAAVAMAGVLAVEGRRPGFRRVVRETLTGRCGWYYGTAACQTFAQLASFVSFDRTSASLASVLSGTQPVLTLLLAAAFLGRSERLRGRTVAAVLLAVAGAAVLSAGGAGG